MRSPLIEEGGAAETCDEITVTHISHIPVDTVRGEVEDSGMKLRPESRKG